jgi:tetratricopeptide (TPR) repeat protein
MKFYILAAALLAVSACGPKTENVNVSVNANSAAAPARSEKLQTVTAHSTENQQPPAMADQSAAAAPGGGGKWSQSGEPIDTSKLDLEIANAEKAVKSKPGDEGAKREAAQAYFNRGVALTDARQYASALGDYRKALKYDPNDEDSKKWIDQITGIYQMLKKQPPAEGEEPPPLKVK